MDSLIASERICRELNHAFIEIATSNERCTVMYFYEQRISRPLPLARESVGSGSRHPII